MSKIFGDFIEREPGGGEYLKIGFQPTSIPLQQRWRNNGLSADFLAGYVSTFFPGEDSSSAERQAEIKDAISFIANELLENAMKFSHPSAHNKVSIEVFLEADAVSLYTSNVGNSEKITAFQGFIERLLAGNPDEMYLQQLERNAEGADDNASGLGFLTMINDYGATLAWRFGDHEQSGDGVEVTTMVRLPV